jgi:hypothetical protein
MATLCTDISENRKFNQASPIAMVVFIAIYIVMTALMKHNLWYFISLIIAFVLCQIFFYYKPRFVFLTAKFLFSNSYLTPSFEDELFLPDERLIEELDRLLIGVEYVKRNQQSSGHGITDI